MANRPLISTTKLATGSLITGVPFNVFSEEVYPGLDAAQIANLQVRAEVGGAHNVNTITPIGGGLSDVTLHQIRIRDAGSAGLRPAWAAVDAAETQMATDAALAETKRLAHYTLYSTPVVLRIGDLVNSWTNPQLKAVQEFVLYMRGNGLVTNGRGRLIALTPVGRAPIEQSFVITVGDDDWLTAAANNSWPDFSA